MADGYQNAGLRVFMTSPRSVLPNVVKQRQMPSLLELHSKRLGAWANLLTCWCGESCKTSQPLVCIWWFGVMRERSCCCVSTYLCRLRNLTGPNRLTRLAKLTGQLWLHIAHWSPSCQCLGCHKRANVYKYNSLEATKPLNRLFVMDLCWHFDSILIKSFKLYHCQQQVSNKVTLVWQQGSICLISKSGLETYRQVRLMSDSTCRVWLCSIGFCLLSRMLRTQTWRLSCLLGSEVQFVVLLPLDVLTLLSQVLLTQTALCIKSRHEDCLVCLAQKFNLML